MRDLKNNLNAKSIYLLKSSLFQSLVRDGEVQVQVHLASVDIKTVVLIFKHLLSN